MNRAVIQLQNPSTAVLAMTVPRPDGPRMLLIEPGQTVDVDVTDMVWPAGPTPAARAEVRVGALIPDLLVVAGPAAVLVALIVRYVESREWPALGMLAFLWGWSYLNVWRAAR